MTKIAMPSDDQVSISGHFGRTKGFLIFDVDGDKVENKIYVENNFTGHAQGLHHDHHHDHQHSHGGILQVLKDCKVIISRGMGRRLLIDFENNNKEVFVTDTSSADEAVDQYLKGVLGHDPDKTCQH
jgi:predicted Fe-Mo cluster-binding NifX family protein